MANFAALIDVLSISGSRLSDGTANASGKVWFFQPGGNDPVSVYSDAGASAVVTAPVTLTNGGLVSRSDYPDGIFATQPIRLYIEDSDGTVVSDNVWIPATAGDVGVDNDGFTDSTLDDVLTRAFTSTGGTDWRYLESAGATERTIRSKFSEIWISVKDFGAVGDGVAIDTTAIQSAMNRVKALGGGVVYFPPGTYKVDQALTHSSATGIRIVGAGNRATTITQTNATANLFTLATPSNCSVEQLRVTHSSSSTGAVIAVSDGTDFVVSDVLAFAGFAYAIDLSGASNWFVLRCQLMGTTRTIRSNTTGSARPSSLVGTIISTGSTAAVEINGAQGSYYFGRNHITATTGILINASYTGTGIVMVGNKFIATTTIDMTGIAADPNIRQWGNGIDASSTSSAIANTQTPVLYRGQEVILTAASGGAGTVTVASPAILPTAGTEAVNLYWDFVFKNAAGGAVTWTLNAIFVVTGAVPTTDGHTISVRFRWDRTTSKLREVSRADTVT